jgi:hypothetical protein
VWRRIERWGGRNFPTPINVRLWTLPLPTSDLNRLFFHSAKWEKYLNAKNGYFFERIQSRNGKIFWLIGETFGRRRSRVKPARISVPEFMYYLKTSALAHSGSDISVVRVGRLWVVGRRWKLTRGSGADSETCLFAKGGHSILQPYHSTARK